MNLENFIKMYIKLHIRISITLKTFLGHIHLATLVAITGQISFLGVIVTLPNTQTSELPRKKFFV